jgi:hypothetical protein
MTGHDQRWMRLYCPICGETECLTAREATTFALHYPVSPEGELRLDVQLWCVNCDRHVRFRLYDTNNGAIPRIERDDPAADSAIYRTHDEPTDT